MSIRVAIDGLNGVSRHVLAAISAGGFADLYEVVHINEPAGIDAVQRRLQQDSHFGRFPRSIAVSGDEIDVDGRSVPVSAIEDASQIEWDAFGVEVVVIDGSAPDTAERALTHLERGALKVVVAGNPGPEGRLVVFGVNELGYSPDTHHIVGTGSARLNAVAIVAKVVQKHFAIARGSFTIVHPTLATQPAIDAAGSDPIEGRSLFNIVPNLPDRTSAELGLLDPILGSKLVGSVVHVPGVAPVAWMALAAETERRLDREVAIRAFSEASTSAEYEGLIGVTSDFHQVSSDMRGDARSVVLSLDELEMVGRAFISVRGWFDTEWALACRTADLIALLCEAGIPGTA